MSRHLLTATALLSLLMFTGCPDHSGTDGGTSDGGQTDGSVTDGGDPDGGVVDAGPPPCASDFDDCGEKESCNLATGECVAAGPCDPQYGFANCNYDSNGQNAPGAGCLMTGPEDCVCDPADGACKKRRQLCEPCTSDEECGANPMYDKPAFCADFAGGKFCLNEAGPMGCPQGYLPDDAGDWCVPNSGTCTQVDVCTKDADCPPVTPVCNLTTGTCAKGCGFNLDTGDSSCPTGKVCDMDGKCRAPCDPANDSCAEINPDYVCKEDVGGVHRCRYDGCIDTRECETTNPDDPYTGFCDLTVHECVFDRCRPENNALNNENPDCRVGHFCDPVTSTCIKMDCVQRGGAAIACGINHICCGECRNAVLKDPNRDACDPTPCDGTETPAGNPYYDGCVVAPNPPWCQSCQEDSECSTPNPKEKPQDGNICNQGLCLPTCATDRDCATRWQCNYMFIGCDPTQSGQCGANGACVDDGSWGAECTAAGDCPENWDCVEQPSSGTNKCHSEFWVCDCNPDGAGGNDANCPDSTRCAMTNRSTGANRCVASKVCIPNSQASEACGL